ncbi:MAG: DUF2330 domain-containing protein [Deltaproteobacteria bacterium]|nr:DUF2330 domain-containing protein [Deltaproteobacteria bacterium]
MRGGAMVRRLGIGTTSVALALAALVAMPPARTFAFCGFYVSGAAGPLYNKATYVVMMRDGLRTVLSMQNNYEGPPESFAMVVPVPVVLQRENVHTLDRAVFDRVDQLAAPRLVEYWEQDPCYRPRVERYRGGVMRRPMARSAPGGARADSDLGVRVEAQFTVGEYDIVILSATDSSGLDTWLRRERYNIPPGAERVLRPYVAAGTKFFVARVNAERVRFENGRALLSPLRFHYDTETFTLPLRLGLLNSAGEQDLIVHILSRGQRYEVANYRNVTVPTNIDVANAVRERFPAFYAALFDRTAAQNPGAVITEYAWGATSCDPCPTSPLSEGDFRTLGSDVIPPRQVDVYDPRGTFVLTRLHYRYTRETLGEDLVFREAGAIVGGREMQGPNGRLEYGARTDQHNNFQARYIIRHWWQGPIRCANPRRGIWGGPPGGEHNAPRAARDLAFVPRGNVDLSSLVRRRVPELGITPRRGGRTNPSSPLNPPMLRPETHGGRPTPRPSGVVRGASMAGCSVAGLRDGGLAAALVLALGALGVIVVRRRTSPPKRRRS